MNRPKYTPEEWKALKVAALHAASLANQLSNSAEIATLMMNRELEATHAASLWRQAAQAATDAADAIQKISRIKQKVSA